ncbi:YlqD family protein [Lentibacillus saliphilus]|uniref:YlqD family protein n=1 Tax=Lentibacillus saliphilus TaxID=2737028 RepID=UPI001C2F24F4|nr:YlqD family protein [Lentibacillus saliphilus]
MKLIKKVLIKHVITEDSRAKLRDDFNAHKMRLEQECQQLLFEQRKMESKKHLQKQEITARFQQEIKNRKEKIKLVDFKIDQLEELKTGTEITEGEVDALVEVEEGMLWSKRMQESKIVIKDDVVIRIDE